MTENGPDCSTKLRRLACFGLTTFAADQLSQFYERALGFRRIAGARRSGSDFERLMGLAGGADSITLGLGDEVIELLQFDRPGRPYPESTLSSDLRFQHFAVVVADMNLAYQRLASVAGWTAISVDGPQKLPVSSGGVTAFKFRDPDGHPLELLAFPDAKLSAYWKSRPRNNLFLGIDHSAISVSSSERSIAFYEALGLRIAGRSLNTGLEQQRLDAVIDAEVEVTALDPEVTTPHLELLCYRSGAHNRNIALSNNDVAATRMVFASNMPSSGEFTGPRALTDPDGHRLEIVATINDSPRSDSILAVGTAPTRSQPR